MEDGKLHDLISQAKMIVSSTGQDRNSFWRAYILVEYAILDLKLRYDLEQEPMLPSKIERKKQAADLVNDAKQKLEKLDFSDKKMLLKDLRSCRDVLKALVARS